MEENRKEAAPENVYFRYENGQLVISWDSHSCPTGYFVKIEFVDAQGEPLVEQPQLQYNEGEAVVLGEINKGDEFRVHVRVVSPWSQTERVVIREIGSIDCIQLDWHSGSLHAGWTPLEDGPYQYEVIVLDNNEQPLDPQPAQLSEGESGVRIDGESLIDGKTYYISVRAKKEGSCGAWSRSNAFVLDKRLPDSPILRALLVRIKTAIAEGQGSFALDREVLASDDLTRLLESLVGVGEQGLPLNQAKVIYEPDKVELIAKATYPFSDKEETTLLFMDLYNNLEMNVTSENIGNKTVQELQAHRLLPKSIYDASCWFETLVVIPNLRLELDSRKGQLALTGTEVSWSVAVGLSEVGFSSMLPLFEVKQDKKTGKKTYNSRVKTKLCLGKETKIPIFLQLPSGLNGWVVGLDAPPEGFFLGDLSLFEPLMGGAHSNLPEAVIGLGNFRLNALKISFSPDQPHVWNIEVAFGIGRDGEGWKAIPGLIEVNELNALLGMTLYQTTDGLSTSSYVINNERNKNSRSSGFSCFK